MKLLEEDLDFVIGNCSDVYPSLGSGTILITGGTGFIGRWLVAVFHELLERKLIDNNVLLIIRDSKSAYKKISMQLNKKIEFIQTNQILDKYTFRNYPEVRYIIHAAGPSSNSRTFNKEEIFQIRELTDDLIKCSKNMYNPPKFIHLSSGAVYGEEARKNKIIIESQALSSLNQTDDYGRMKQQIEVMIDEATNQGFIQGINPRLFTFSGYGTTLDGKFAIGNFISDALKGNPIQVNGNSLTTRSYLYITDLIEWILLSLVLPCRKELHFGSAQPITMKELALAVASVFSQVEIDFLGERIEQNHYVPSIINTLDHLGTSEKITLEEGIIKWQKTLEIN